MCLDVKFSRKLTADSNIHNPPVGYKWLNMDKFGRLFLPTAGNTTKLMPRGKWLKEEDYRAGYHPAVLEVFRARGYYPLGFHIYKHYQPYYTFQSWSADMRCVQVQLTYGDHVAVGLQGTHIVIVARQIMISNTPKEMIVNLEARK